MDEKNEELKPDAQELKENGSIQENKELEKTDEGFIADLEPKELGRRGEKAAAAYLERRGFMILERNWSCRFGEVDIIAFEEETIVFVEVKTRRGIDQGLPEDAVTPAKRHRYEKIAACYLEEHEHVDYYVRFDVIAILAVSQGRALLRHHRSAFSRAE